MEDRAKTRFAKHFTTTQILILDESFNALDYRSEIEIFKKIKKSFHLLLFFMHPTERKISILKGNTYKTQVKWAKNV